MTSGFNLELQNFKSQFFMFFEIARVSRASVEVCVINICLEEICKLTKKVM